MRNDVVTVIKKHINELYQILDKYNISDKLNFISAAETDLVFQRAVLMSVGYIGELSKKLSDNIQNSAPNVNWRRLSRSRNIIFHDYDIADMEVISSVVFKDIAGLRLSLMQITKADKSDLKEILELQYLAYQSEAVLLNNFEIPPLKQTLEEVEQEYAKGIFLKAVDTDGKIIGSVRAYIETQNNTAYIGKLIVLPEKQSQGIGTKLVQAIEQECFDLITRYEIFTSDKSLRTIRLYEYLGYAKFKEQKISDKLNLVFLEKYK